MLPKGSRPKVLVDEGGDEMVSLPVTEVRGSKPHKDGSVLFKMVGGPYNGQTLRVFSPFMRVVFTRSNGEIAIYKLHPPKKLGGLWVYAHDADDQTGLTEEERGDHDKAARDARMARWGQYLANKRDRELEESFVGNIPTEELMGDEIETED